MALIIVAGYVVTVYPRPALYNHFLLAVYTIILVINAALAVFLCRDRILSPVAAKQSP